jgi:hypothetical protein
MRAAAGDRVRVEGHHLGEPCRRGEIFEVRGTDGGPPFVVRWDDSDHAVLFFPGSDTSVEHVHEPERRAEAC